MGYSLTSGYKHNLRGHLLSELNYAREQMNEVVDYFHSGNLLCAEQLLATVKMNIVMKMGLDVIIQRHEEKTLSDAILELTGIQSVTMLLEDICKANNVTEEELQANLAVMPDNTY